MPERSDVQPVRSFEHPGYFRNALPESQERLILVSPWLGARAGDQEFVTALEALLDRGAHAYLGWGTGTRST